MKPLLLAGLLLLGGCQVVKDIALKPLKIAGVVPTVVDPSTGEERDMTLADVVIDKVSAAGGAATGNPFLWGLGAAAAAGAVGAARKKTKKA